MNVNVSRIGVYGAAQRTGMEEACPGARAKAGSRFKTELRRNSHLRSCVCRIFQAQTECEERARLLREARVTRQDHTSGRVALPAVGAWAQPTLVCPYL